MKKFLYISCSIFLLYACNTKSPEEGHVKSPHKAFYGKYLIQLNPEQIEAKAKDAGVGEKFIFSLLSPLKLSANFKESGYVQFEGEYGLLDFAEIESDKDSVAFLVKGDKLYIDNIEINNDDYFTFKLVDKSKIILYADSLELLLTPKE